MKKKPVSDQINLNVKDCYKDKPDKENKSVDTKICLCFSFRAVTTESPFDE